MSSSSSVHVSRSGSVFINSPASAPRTLDPHRPVGRDSASLIRSTPLRAAAATSSFAADQSTSGRRPGATGGGSVSSYALRLTAGHSSSTGRSGGGADPYARFAPSTTFVASASARKPAIGSQSPTTAHAHGPSAAHSLMKTATRASEVASALGQSLRERGREQTQMQSSIRDYESRVSVLTAVVQRMEAEAARARAAGAELKEKLQAAELRAAEEREGRVRAEAAAEEEAAAAAATREEARGESEAAAAAARAAEEQLAGERARGDRLEAAERQMRREAGVREDDNATLRAELAELQAAHEAAEAARVRRQAAEVAAREAESANSREKAEAAQAAIIRDQLIDDLRFKDELIMSLRNDLDGLRGVEEKKAALELALETSQRALDNAVSERLAVDKEAAALATEKAELLQAVAASRGVLEGMRDSLREMHRRANRADEAVLDLEAAALEAREESRLQLQAREAAAAEAAAARSDAGAARDDAEAQALAVARLQHQCDGFSAALSRATVEGNRLKADLQAAGSRAAQSAREAQAARRAVAERDAALRRAQDQMVALSRDGAESVELHRRAQAAREQAEAELAATRARAQEAEGRAGEMQQQAAAARADYERVADALGRERDARRHAEAKGDALGEQLGAAREAHAGLERQLKDKYEDLAALTVKRRHDVGERDERISGLQEECGRLQQLLQGKVDAENTLLDGIRAATAARGGGGSGGGGGGGNDTGRSSHGSPNVHISRTGSVFIQ